MAKKIDAGKWGLKGFTAEPRYDMPGNFIIDANINLQCYYSDGTGDFDKGFEIVSKDGDKYYYSGPDATKALQAIKKYGKGRISEDDAIEVKSKKDMSSKDQKDVKDATVEESTNVEDDKKGAVVVATEDDDDTDDKKVVVKEKKSIKESTDHIVGIVSSGKLHLLEDGIMGVINSKLVEKLDAAKAQIKAKAVFKGA